jgi:endonuclease/exonuclease/phosphatase (EEP) superfamily protein YafD
MVSEESGKESSTTGDTASDSTSGNEKSSDSPTDTARWSARFARGRDMLLDALIPVIWITVFATYLGNFGSVTFLFDLLSHFRLQYLVVQALFLILATTTRRWFLIAVCLAGLGANAMEIAPFYTTPIPTVAADAKRISVLHINVNSQNRQFQKVVDLIAAYKPDIVCIQELSTPWDAFLSEKLKSAGYTSKIARVRDDNFGIGMYSKLDMLSSQIIESKGETKHFPVPGAFASFELKGHKLSVITIHPLPPMSEEMFALRNEEFAAINASRDSIKDPFILVGDLNCSPWSYYFKKLEERSRAINASLGYGLQPTWPVYLPPLRIPIDHVLASKDLAAVKYQVLEPCGSDHLPVYVELVLRAQPAPAAKPRVPYRH